MARQLGHVKYKGTMRLSQNKMSQPLSCEIENSVFLNKFLSIQISGSYL